MGPGDLSAPGRVVDLIATSYAASGSERSHIGALALDWPGVEALIGG